MTISRFSIVLIVFLIALLAFAAYAPATIAFQTTPAATAAATMEATPMASVPAPAQAPALPPTALQVNQNSTLGANILTDSQGRTLYVFMKDTSGTSSACTGSCAQTWLPFTGTAMTPSAASSAGTPAATEMAPSASSSTGTIDPSQITTFQRDDGTMQVAYSGHPLYYYSGDTNPGDAMGQGVGGNWFAVSPDGTPFQNGGSATPGAGDSTPSASPTSQ